MSTMFMATRCYHHHVLMRNVPNGFNGSHRKNDSLVLEVLHFIWIVIYPVDTVVLRTT